MREIIFLTILFFLFENFTFSQKTIIDLGFSCSKVLNLSNIQKKEDSNIQEQPDDNTKTDYNKELIVSNIDLTTFTNENLKIPFENVTRKNPLLYLKITRKDGENSKVRIILENKKILVITTDSLKVKGKLKFINKDSIQLKSTSIAINKIMIIKKPINAARITGNIIGGLFSYVGVASSIDLYEPIYLLIGSAISIPFYAMNYVRRKYDLKSKWKAEIIYEKK
jgi:hypothetical protein